MGIELNSYLGDLLERMKRDETGARVDGLTNGSKYEYALTKFTHPLAV